MDPKSSLIVGNHRAGRRKHSPTGSGAELPEIQRQGESGRRRALQCYLHATARSLGAFVKLFAVVSIDAFSAMCLWGIMMRHPPAAEPTLALGRNVKDKHVKYVAQERNARRGRERTGRREGRGREGPCRGTRHLPAAEPHRPEATGATATKKEGRSSKFTLTEGRKGPRQ